MEAMKALNSGNHADMEAFSNSMYGCDDFAHTFELSLKDTYEQELTDMLFVILTLMKDCNMDIMFHVGAGLEYNAIRGKKL